ncbi:MAG: YfcC family protein [bacterium]|nr:YfcC family protein [bacterium]
MAASRIRIPHTLVLLFAMIIVAFVATYVLPQGSFERVETESGRQQVVPGSYTAAEETTRLPVQTIFTAVPRGFAAAEEIIFFVFIVGGAFGVFRATGAADALIKFLLDEMGNVPWLLIAGGLLMFCLGSSTIGMAEEYMPFVPVLVGLCIGLRYDTVTAVGILCCGYSIGYGAALINPFTVFIAQDIAGIEQGSGMAYRALLTVVFFAIAFQHVYSYARKVRADPSKSLVADQTVSSEQGETKDVALTAHRVACIALVVGSLGLLTYGLKFRGWYLIEMGAMFLGLSIVIGLVGKLGIDRTAREFCTGAAELTTTALLIGFARTIQIVLDDGHVVDTIVNGVALPLQALGSHGAAVGMLFVQTLCNLFIPSGSGQAYVTMPIMAPLGDLVGVSRQVAVLAYQFGDGFSNIIVPTSPVLMGILAMARIPYDRWLRFVVPFLLKVWLAAAIALVAAVAFGYS